MERARQLAVGFVSEYMGTVPVRHITDAGAAACNATREQTMGYQRCWRDIGHDGPHTSQDGKTYGESAVVDDRWER